ncbi:MAG: hypothetical protein RBT34_12595 [Anaerolineaceae bacterium]|jgi:hypothetical protein|nr:hypothetical protein [Anaerolineaceae bacterium]
MTNTQLDLASIFKTVTSTLAQNQSALNEADTYNHDHGTHMVDIFNTITKAVGSKQGKDAATQLKYAGEQLLKGEHSGSAEMYGKNLLEAASQLKGQQLTADNGMQLVQMLLGAQQPAQQQPAAGGMLGSLLGGLAAGGTSEGLDAGDLLNAGMAFMQARKSGDSNAEALLDAVVAASSAGQSQHRAQSGKLVAFSLLEAFSGLKK